MSDEQVKHLELIQGVVNRLAGNSFAYKGWAITLIAALFALGSKESQPAFLLVALLPALAFWGLDAYYLWQERLFRALWNDIRHMDEATWRQNPFTMDTSPYRAEEKRYIDVLFSSTIAGLYLPLVLVVLAVVLLAFVGTLASLWPVCRFRW